MSKSNIVTRRSAGLADNDTYFGTVGGSFTNVLTEINKERPVRDAGTFSNLFVYVSANTASVSTTVTLRKSQADTALLVTYTSDQTGVKEDTSNTATFAATDEAAIEITIPAEAGANTFTIQILSLEFTPDAAENCITLLACTHITTANITAASATSYLKASGQWAANAGNGTESNTKYRIRAACIAQDLYTYVATNGRTTDTVFRTRKNGANGGQSVTYPNLQTGAKEDTGGTDSLQAGDDFNYQYVTGTGTQGLTLSLITTTLVSTGGDFFFMVSDAQTTTNYGVGAVSYTALSGSPTADFTETNTRFLPRFTWTAKELGILVTTNTMDAATIVSVRDGGVTSAVTTTYLAGQTGLKNDSVNAATITAATDNVNHATDTSASLSGSFSVQWIGLIGHTDVVAAGQPYMLCDNPFSIPLLGAGGIS